MFQHDVIHLNVLNVKKKNLQKDALRSEGNMIAPQVLHSALMLWLGLI